MARTIQHMRLTFFLIILTLLTSCRGFPIGRGETLYTQYSIRYETDEIHATNYRVGELLPINSAVRFIGRTRRHEFLVEVIESETVLPGTELRFTNNSRHTGVDARTAFLRTFRKRPVNLELFSEEEQAAIRKGEIFEGMGRDAVLAAIGRPAYSLTPAGSTRKWTYALRRWSKFHVYFDEDNRVNRIDR